jgi:hypothetical protein
MNKCILPVILLSLKAFGECKCDVFEMPEVDEADDILIVYPLLADEVDAFSCRDGQISDFWSGPRWQERDRIVMTTERNSYPGRDGWDGSDDARVRIQAGADSTGLYLYIEIFDDAFVDPVGDIHEQTDSTRWQYDAVEIFFDLISSNEFVDTTPALIAVDNTQLSFDSRHFQAWMGKTSSPQEMRLSYCDVSSWAWDSVVVSIDNEVNKLHGMGVDPVQVDENHKVQEWYIPWGPVSARIEGMLDGRRFAFSAGYNDLDGDGDPVNSLRWRNLDPSYDEKELAEAGFSMRTTWGDLHMADGIGESVVHRPCCQPPCCQPSIGVKSARRFLVMDDSHVKSVEYFTLLGRRVSVEAARQMRNQNAAVLVRRVRLRDGTFRYTLTPKPGE